MKQLEEWKFQIDKIDSLQKQLDNLRAEMADANLRLAREVLESGAYEFVSINKQKIRSYYNRMKRHEDR